MRSSNQDVQHLKGEWVRNMFSAIAPSYDLANILLSFNQDRNWKRTAVKELVKNPGTKYLDVATGTADIAIEIIRQTSESTQVVGIDFAKPMLDVGVEKIARAGLSNRIKLQEGDALSLPFEDNAFDGAISVWGVRNFSDPRKGIDEMRRVLVPGGKMIILEFFHPTFPVWKQAYEFYFQNVAPYIGGLVSGKKYAYDYLPRSVKSFPTMDKFKKIIEEQGFKDVFYHPFLGGVAAMHVAVK